MAAGLSALAVCGGRRSGPLPQVAGPSRVKGGQVGHSHCLVSAHGESVSGHGLPLESGGPISRMARQTVPRSAAERGPVSGGRAAKPCRRPAYGKGRRFGSGRRVLIGLGLSTLRAASGAAKSRGARASSRTKRVVAALLVSAIIASSGRNY